MGNLENLHLKAEDMPYTHTSDVNTNLPFRGSALSISRVTRFPRAAGNPGISMARETMTGAPPSL